MKPLIQVIADSIAQHHPMYMKASNRASVALILRVTGYPKEAYMLNLSIAGSAANTEVQALDSFLRTTAGRDAGIHNTEVLFIKRATRAGDAWSGNVAFPGGKRDASDASDQAVAVRETHEEIGLQLDNTAQFHCLGRLDSRPIYSGGQAREDSCLTPFVYLQIAQHTPPLVVEAGEVASVRWVPLAHLLRRCNVMPTGIAKPFVIFPPARALPAFFQRALGLHVTYFPAVDLPPHAVSGTALPTGLTEDTARHAIHMDFRLWGMTLSTVGDFLHVPARHPDARAASRLLWEHCNPAWPPVWSGGVIPNAMLRVVYGAVEVKEWVSGGRRWQDVHVTGHVLPCALLALSTVLLAVHTVQAA